MANLQLPLDLHPPTTDIALPFAPRQPLVPVAEALSTRIALPATKRASATLAAVETMYAAPAQLSPANAIDDPTASLADFTLPDLAQFTLEKKFSTNASGDVHLFFVGRDDVHELLKYILSRVRLSLYLNMFGYDDDELNNLLMQKALDANISMMVTLDKSQAGGVHEKALLEADRKFNLAAFNTHFVLGQSATHQISHTKGFVADGRVACEGSTNWSSSGEGTFIVHGAPGGPTYRAQNNTQAVITDPDTIVRFQTELIAEHMTALSQNQAAPPPAAAPARARRTRKT